MQLSYPLLAEEFVQGSTVRLVSMGCSDWLGSAAVRMQVCGGSLCCISLLLIQKPALSSKPYLYAAAAAADHFIIVNMRQFRYEIVVLINGELRTSMA